MKNIILPKPGERVEFASRFITPCEKLLDVGCGEGILNSFIKNNVKQIYGLDNSKSALLKAKSKGVIIKNIDFDKDAFPYKNEYFDTITCLDIIEHVKDPILLLTETYRVLNKNGILIISTPNIRFSDHLFKLIIEGVFPKTSEDPELYDGGHIHFFTFKDIRDLLSKKGFEILREEGIINKIRRGWKGRLLEKVLGKRFMLEFRTPGILIVAKK